jgi:3-isopropylmalate dehydrogenase
MSLAGELVGSLGLAPSLNYGDKHLMAQAVHGAAPDIAGKGIANPIGILLSTTMLLEQMALKHDDTSLAALARRIDAGISQTLADKITTPDLGGTANTASFTDAVIERL